jgi:uncharacterized protein (TIGR00255 family)
MTGFGAATRTEGTSRVSAEIKSVNNRHLKVQTRLPRSLSGLESAVEGEVRRMLQRGPISVTVRAEDESARRIPAVDVEAARQYHADLGELRRSLDLGTDPGHDEAALLVTLPGVLRDLDENGSTADAGLREQVEAAVREALGALIADRESEGKHLREALEEHLRVVSRHLERLKRRAPQVPREYRDRLRQRLEGLLRDLDPQIAVAEADLLREVATFADRADITEELQRLETHVARFGQILGGEAEMGRPLDFLLQEMLREANTVGAKANDTEIAHGVVELKSEIERMKEQVQNLE